MTASSASARNRKSSAKRTGRKVTRIDHGATSERTEHSAAATGADLSATSERTDLSATSERTEFSTTRERIESAVAASDAQAKVTEESWHIVGVDVSKSHLDIFVSHSGQLVRMENHAAAIDRFLNRFADDERGQLLVVMESTGGYEATLQERLQAAGMARATVNPARVRQFAESCGQLEKTDALDARIIARFGEIMQPQPDVLLDEHTQTLRDLSLRREQILSQLQQEQNRLEHTRCAIATDSLKAACRFYDKQLRKIDADIAKHIREHEPLAHKARLLTSTPGVGKVTATVLISQLPELGELNRGEIAKLAGVAPIANDSGQKSGQRRTKGGRSSVRRTLYMATLVATRFNPRIRSAYVHMRQRGKCAKVAIVACMRKLLTMLNCMLHNNEPWRMEPPKPLATSPPLAIAAS